MGGCELAIWTMMKKEKRRPQPAGRWEIFSWCWYDFANSAFVTVVVTVVGGVFFTKTVCGGASWAEFAWGTALSVSAALAMGVGPFLGRWADRKASKKMALLVATMACVIGTALLALPGTSVLGVMVILVVANAAFLLGENLVASFLPELAEPGRRGRVSAYGWAFGYLGGLCSLAMALFLLRSGGEAAARRVFWATGLFIFLAALPTMLFLRERAVPGECGSEEPEWKMIWKTLHGHPELVGLLSGLTVALTGLSAVVGFASIYATTEIGFTLEGTVKLFVCLQVAAAVGALVTGGWQDRAGSRIVLLSSLALWVGVSLAAYLSRSVESFYGVAAGAGVGMGWLQSAGRAAVAEMTPMGKEGECFGLWGFAGKLAGIGGPLAFGGVAALFGMRSAILINGVWFLLGGLLLGRVKLGNGKLVVEPRG
ncbi:MFS transporter [bacterium]|nr:MFS transporter [bacterium]